MSLRLFLCLLLICASFPLVARDVRMMGANGDNGDGCQDSVARSDEASARPAASKPAAHTVKPSKAKANAAHGSDNLGGARPPRWHSFLPGMFR